MRFFFDAIGSAMYWAERQPPLEMVAFVLATAAILYVVLVMAEGPAG